MSAVDTGFGFSIVCGGLIPRENVRGENNHNAKLSEQQAVEIKYSDKPDRFFAEKFRVARETVRSVRLGINWRHI